MIGKKFIISGMTLEIVSDAGEQWETLNVTTKETVLMNKIVLQNAVKLAKTGEVTE